MKIFYLYGKVEGEWFKYTNIITTDMKREELLTTLRDFYHMKFNESELYEIDLQSASTENMRPKVKSHYIFKG